MENNKFINVITSGFFLCLALIMPLLTGQIRELGNALCPMHFPVILCGYICGAKYACIIGLIAPVMRFFIFGAPVFMPIGIAMCLELATYGFASGFLYKVLKDNKYKVYISLILSMLLGRIIWGIARVMMFDFWQYSFGWMTFITEAFIVPLPGIILQLIIIPVLVTIISKIRN